MERPTDPSLPGKAPLLVERNTLPLQISCEANIPKFRLLVEEHFIWMKPEHDPLSWRRNFDRDTKSVFWLLLYWAVVMYPVQGPTEAIDPGAWTNLFGRNNTPAGPPGLTHSSCGRQWLRESDVRNDPTYIAEAFQRLIFQFILDHRDHKFMDCVAAIEFRSAKRMPQSNALSATISEIELNRQE